MGEAALFYPTADNPVPEGGEAFYVTPEKGLKVRAGLWRQGHRGTIIILPGRTEMIEKYFETGGELLARGFAVAIIDWRGQGASSRLRRNPLKGFVEDFKDYNADLAALLARIEGAAPRPWVLLAHSMGGHVAIRALHDVPGRFAGAVLTAPMLGIKLAGAPFVGALSRTIPAGAFVPGGAAVDPYQERFAANPVTHEARRFERNLNIIRQHRALALGAPTWGWLRAAFASTRQIFTRGYLEAIDVPLLLITAGLEQLVDNRAIQSAARRLRQAKSVRFDKACHEILMETDDIRAEFWRHFDGFVAALKM